YFFLVNEIYHWVKESILNTAFVAILFILSLCIVFATTGVPVIPDGAR
ncbi:unnamed protein product, partial [marine sediment metagenome]